MWLALRTGFVQHFGCCGVCMRAAAGLFLPTRLYEQGLVDCADALAHTWRDAAYVVPTRQPNGSDRRKRSATWFPRGNFTEHAALPRKARPILSPSSISTADSGRLSAFPQIWAAVRAGWGDGRDRESPRSRSAPRRCRRSCRGGWAPTGTEPCAPGCSRPGSTRLELRARRAAPRPV